MSRSERTTVRRLVIRSGPEKNFTILSRHFLQDERLSAPALAIGVYVLSQAPTWEVRPRQLAAYFGFGKNKIYDVLNELATAGYVARRRLKNEKGFFDGCEYVICDDKGMIGEVKAEWREAGTPALGESQAEAADEDSMAYEEEAEAEAPEQSVEGERDLSAHPCPENRDTDRVSTPRPCLRGTANRDTVERKDIYKSPHSPPTAAAALRAQPPLGEKKRPTRRSAARPFVIFRSSARITT